MRNRSCCWYADRFREFVARGTPCGWLHWNRGLSGPKDLRPDSTRKWEGRTRALDRTRAGDGCVRFDHRWPPASVSVMLGGHDFMNYLLFSAITVLPFSAALPQRNVVLNGDFQRSLTG